MKWTTTAIPPDDAQFLETRRFQLEEIARWFNIPVSKLRATGGSTYSSLEQENQAFLSETLRPWLVRIEQEVEDVLTAIALVAGGFGACVTTASTASLRLPGVMYRPLVSHHLREIELSCLYRQADESPLLAAFVAVVRDFAATMTPPKEKPTTKRAA
jgi:DNA-binding transcriptional LysR family regulator